MQPRYGIGSGRARLAKETAPCFSNDTLKAWRGVERRTVPASGTSLREMRRLSLGSLTATRHRMTEFSSTIRLSNAAMHVESTIQAVVLVELQKKKLSSLVNHDWTRNLIVTRLVSCRS